MKYRFCLITLFAIALPVAAEHEGRDKHPKSPPQEAIDACVDKQESDVVTFTGRRGESLEATCRMIEGVLVAVPNHHKMRRE